jgi:NAD(P)-dependent dehydrogenase (short-subunit alcohol dehydrogenase family)
VGKRKMSDYHSAPYVLTKSIKQSPPIDVSKPYNKAWLKGKHILITGGANGLGEACVRQWAAAGASIVIADISIERGEATARDIQEKSGNNNVHFVVCDVCDWQQQVDMFKKAIELSEHGGIDVVVANAGIAGPEPLQTFEDLSGPNPPKPNYKTIDVNLIGVLYTAQLALYWLPKNPKSKACSPDSDPTSPRDRCLILVGSMASLYPVPMQPLYTATKHAVLGIFRTLRASSFVDGVRVNLICPYFIESRIIGTGGRLLMAGTGMGKPEFVADAASRLVADSRILGRALAVGPHVRMKQDDEGNWEVLPRDSKLGYETSIFEMYAGDYEDVEAFQHRMVGMLKAVQKMKGPSGMIMDVWRAIKYKISGSK